MIHVIGEILVDIFDNEGHKEIFPGGAPFNVASNVNTFGGKVSFYGKVGKDDYGKFLKKFAKHKKFEQLLLKTSSTRDTTQALVTLRNGERSFKFIRDNGADYALSINDVEKLDIKKNDIVHIGSLMLSYPRGRRFFYKAIEYAKNKGALISFDVNYRDDIFESPEVAKRIYKKAIKCADIVKISDEELNVLSNKKTLRGKIKSLVLPNQFVFISKGKEGSLIYFNDYIQSVSTKPIEPVDTTGAGDAFYSYVLYELDKNSVQICKEFEIINILLKANIVGAFATQKKGAIDVVPTIEQLDEYLKEFN